MSKPRIMDRLKVFEADLAAAQADYEDVLLRLEAAPEDQVLITQRDELEREMSDHKLNIEREHVKQRAAAATQTVAAKEAELRQGVADAAHVAANMQRIAEIDRKVILCLENTIAPMLAEREKLAVDSGALEWAILKRSYGARRAFGFHNVVRELSRTVGGRGHLVDAIFASGLGRTGLDLGDFMTITPARVGRPHDESANKAMETVRTVLATAIEHRRAEFEDRLPKDEAPTAEDRFIKGGRKIQQARGDSFVAMRDAGGLE